MIYAFLVIKQIQAIYREEGKLNELSSKERLMRRQLVIKPLVDAFNVLAVERLLFFGILLANILSACGKAG